MKKINIYILLSVLIVTSLAAGAYLIFTPDEEQHENISYSSLQVTTVTTEVQEKVEEHDPLFFKPIITREGNLIKTILYTLQDGEELMYNEYQAMLTGNTQNFAAMIKDENENTFLIFNGKKIETHGADIHYLRVEEPDGYYYIYRLERKMYMNLFGEIIGPYEGFQRLSTLHVNERMVTTEREFFYWYVYSDSSGDWVSSGKDSQIAGPFETAKVFTISEEKKQFGYAYKKEEHWFEVINGKTYGPYEKGAPHLQGGETAGDNYIFRYGVSGEVMVNHNNAQWGPYQSVGNTYLTPYNDYGFRFLDGEKDKENPFYLHINGVDYGPYRYIEYDILFPAPGKFMFHAETHNKEKYLNINGEIHGPYENGLRHYAYDMSPNGNYIYGYGTQDKKNNYLNINGEIISTGQKEIVRATIQDSGEYAYSYNDHKLPYPPNYYYVIGDSLWGPYEDIQGPMFIAGDKYMFGYMHKNRYYVNVNGDIQGPFWYLKFNPENSYLNTDGSYKYGFYADKSENLSICENGNIYLHSPWQRAVSPFSPKNIFDLESKDGIIEIYSPGRKYQLEAYWGNSYVTVNGERYGDCTPTNMNYNPDNHSFVWIGIEYEYGYESPSLIKYELLLDK